MSNQKTIAEKTNEIIDELFSTIPIKDRCPHIRKDDKGPYCSINLNPNNQQIISNERRMICDVCSLQLWCMDKYHNCIFYRGEPIG